MDATFILFLSFCQFFRTGKISIVCHNPMVLLMNTSHPHTPWRAYSAHAIFETAPPLLWPKVADFAGLPELVPEMVASGSVEGAGVGAVRTLNFADGKSAKETLISFHSEE